MTTKKPAPWGQLLPSWSVGCVGCHRVANVRGKHDDRDSAAQTLKRSGWTCYRATWQCSKCAARVLIEAKP